MSVSPSFGVSDASAKPVALRRLPFAFAKRHEVLLQLGVEERVWSIARASLPAVGALRFAGGAGCGGIGHRYVRSGGERRLSAGLSMSFSSRRSWAIIRL